MRLNEALKMMNICKRSDAPTGFMVHFEVRGHGVLSGDYFPDAHAGEPLFPTFALAQAAAQAFANTTDSKTVVNIYVVDHEFVPVRASHSEKLNPYSPGDLL